jgi:hypothetical protein
MDHFTPPPLVTGIPLGQLEFSSKICKDISSSMRATEENWKNFQAEFFHI